MISGDDQGSVTGWIDRLKTGDESAVAALWGRYFRRLVRLARSRLSRSARATSDEEDVALSAFHCLYRRAIRGRFPRLDDRDDLWRLLATITAQKTLDLNRRLGRRKRGGDGKLIGSTAGAGTERTGAPPDPEQLASREPGPEVTACLAEQFERLIGQLEDPALRRIALWKMEGFTNEEIAGLLGSGLRTVERKLGVIRATWLADEPT